jgi:hypothetical protein
MIIECFKFQDCNHCKSQDMGYGTSPEKHPAGSGPYANSGGIRSLRFPPVYGTMNFIWANEKQQTEKNLCKSIDTV